MRILVPYSFAFGDKSFPWNGLVDPKFDVKIPWLLNAQFLPPVNIPLIDVSEPGVRFRYGYSNLVGICAYVSALELVTEQATLGACVSFTEIEATFSMQKVCVDADVTPQTIVTSQSAYASCASSVRVPVRATQACIGVDT